MRERESGGGWTEWGGGRGRGGGGKKKLGGKKETATTGNKTADEKIDQSLMSR